MSDVKVYAIRYATSTAPKSTYFYGSYPDVTPTPMDFFFWLVLVGGRRIVVDAAFGAEVGARRGKTMIGDPLATLAALGAPADTVDDVVLTHLHYDHCGLVNEFSNARFWVQATELEFWSGPHAQRLPFRSIIEPEDIKRVIALDDAGRVRKVDGEAIVAPGVTTHLVGGHSAGMQVVRVETDGGPLVLASDSCHLYEQMETDLPSSVVYSLPLMLAAFDRLRELAGRDGFVVPGHDPLTRDLFQTVIGLEDVALDLTAPNTAQARKE